MKAPFDMLDPELPRQGCDSTLQLARGWLESGGMPVEAVVTWLQDNGGFCDCEALADSEEAWRDAVHTGAEGTGARAGDSAESSPISPAWGSRIGPSRATSRSFT